MIIIHLVLIGLKTMSLVEIYIAMHSNRKKICF